MNKGSTCQNKLVLRLKSVCLWQVWNWLKTVFSFPFTVWENVKCGFHNLVWRLRSATKLSHTKTKMGRPYLIIYKLASWKKNQEKYSYFACYPHCWHSTKWLTYFWYILITAVLRLQNILIKRMPLQQGNLLYNATNRLSIWRVLVYNA